MSPNMRRRRAGRLRCARRLTAAAALMLLAGCTQPTAMQQIRARGELRMVTLNSPTCYYFGAHGPEGFEYRLAGAFAHTLGLRLVVQTVPDAAAMRAALAHGSADLAAAQISPDAAWRAAGLATTSYAQIVQLVVHGRGKPGPHDLQGLRNARIVVFADSPQQQLLQSLHAGAIPDLSWSTVARSQAEPLDLVTSGTADLTIVDASDFAFAQHLYPESTVAFAMPDARSAQWVVRAGATELLQAADAFFAAAKVSGELARIEGEANTESGDFDYASAHQFQADIAARLPALQALFEEAAQLTGLDWRLLAAIGYQESKWQGSAASSDGASGIMMLTGDTAATVGVNDRADLRQNIIGGAKYLAQVLDTIPQRIADPDRTWLAVAAYNVGYGHLEDARVLAQMHGRNPDSWADVREQLPLLAQEHWYLRVKRGYARGWEPVKFVDQVRQYLAVLEWIGADKSARNAVPLMRAASLVSPGGTAPPLGW
ncbi:MAG TPA: membrane-bound lytic murein transglycosylase MltF [Steroidobacteraceae bacterium]